MKKIIAILLSVLMLCSAIPFAAASSHIYEIYEVYEPDCENEGYTEYYCVLCGDYYYDDYTDALGHNYEIYEVVDPDCENEGYTDYTCTECGDYYYDDFTDALGHNYEITVYEPTCEEKGCTEYFCVVCWYWYETDFTPALGHAAGDEVIENEIEVSCDHDGSYDEVIYCTECEEELSRETVIIPALDHIAGDEIIEEEYEPDCENEGSYDKVIYCTECEEELSRETVIIPALGHDYEITVYEPTCEEKGCTEYFCVVCWYWYETDFTPALGHAAGDEVIENEIEVSCDHDGSYDEVIYCTECEEELSRETVIIPALGHNYEIYEVVDPTCENEGYTDYTCTECGDYYYDDFTDALGHDYEITVYDPTCDEQGFTEYYCPACEDYYVDDYTNALGHNYVIYKVVAPECEYEGYTEYVCTDCYDWYYDDFTDALVHIYDNEYDAECNICGGIRDDALVYGDADGDYDLTIGDVSLLQQYLAGYDVIIEKSADADGDGAITVGDASLIQQYLAGYDVELGPIEQGPLFNDGELPEW